MNDSLSDVLLDPMVIMSAVLLLGMCLLLLRFMKAYRRVTFLSLLCGSFLWLVASEPEMYLAFREWLELQIPTF